MEEIIKGGNSLVVSTNLKTILVWPTGRTPNPFNAMQNKRTHIHKAPLPRGLHANALGRRWVGMVRLRLEGGSLSLDLLPMDVAEAA